MPRAPPDLRAVVSYAQAFPSIWPLLQSEFQPVSSCVGQVHWSMIGSKSIWTPFQ
jgi:hypothetical protein